MKKSYSPVTVAVIQVYGVGKKKSSIQCTTMKYYAVEGALLRTQDRGVPSEHLKTCL